MFRMLAVAAVALFALRAEAAGWSKNTVDTFVGSCAAAAGANGAKEDRAQAYCGCVAQTLQKKYGEKQFMAASTKPTDAFNADIQAAIRACGKELIPAAKPGQVGWSDMFRSAFVGSCVDGATEKGAEKKKAEGYCACVSESLQKTYSEDAFAKASFNPTEKYNADVVGAAKGCVKFLQP